MSERVSPAGGCPWRSTRCSPSVVIWHHGRRRSRLAARLLLQTALEAEVTELLDRAGGRDRSPGRSGTAHRQRVYERRRGRAAPPQSAALHARAPTESCCHRMPAFGTHSRSTRSQPKIRLQPAGRAYGDVALGRSNNPLWLTGGNVNMRSSSWVSLVNRTRVAASRHALLSLRQDLLSLVEFSHELCHPPILSIDGLGVQT